MVKHIKKAYSKDGKLTKREKSIAYATAWKDHNEEINYPKDYDPPKSWSKPPSGKELNKMAKYYAKKDKKIKEGKLPIISPGLEMPDMAIVKNRVKKKIDKKWEELKDTHRLHQEEIK